MKCKVTFTHGETEVPYPSIQAAVADVRYVYDDAVVIDVEGVEHGQDSVDTDYAIREGLAAFVWANANPSIVATITVEEET